MLRILVGLLVLVALAVPAASAKRVALVIGNADYKFVTPLANPINDAALMEKTLKNAGFEVIRRDNLNQQGMKLALVEFSRILKQGAEAGMFYYAGHGIEVEGKNYLVPIDSNMQSKEEVDAYNYEVDDFLKMMENSGVPFNIIVLDACRNNPFRGLRATGGGLAPVNAPVGSYVAYSTSPGSVAEDGTGVNSPFTEALAASISTPGLGLEDVFKQTRSKVRAATNGAQVPFDSSSIEGNFYFLPESANEERKRPLTDLVKDQSKTKALKRVALVIGNGSYEKANQLLTAKNDANEIAKTLVGIGFEVISGTDLDYRAMQSELLAFATRATRADISLFYYAGLGVQYNGLNYIMPIDAKLESKEAISFEMFDVEKAVIKYMGVGNQTGIVLLDYCGENPILRKLKKTRSVSDGQGLATILPEGGNLMIGLAASPGETCQDVEGDNSAFAAALIKNVATPNLELEQIMKRVKKHVYETTEARQNPWFFSSLRDEVYLHRE